MTLVAQMLRAPVLDDDQADRLLDRLRIPFGWLDFLSDGERREFSTLKQDLVDRQVDPECGRIPPERIQVDKKSGANHGPTGAWDPDLELFPLHRGA